jgi:hypothetical protein
MHIIDSSITENDYDNIKMSNIDYDINKTDELLNKISNLEVENKHLNDSILTYQHSFTQYDIK